ncbi:MAG: response regulator [Planctomycetes bacterium]|nr:response regulator [Planctomycetota bacterium]
MMVAKQGRSYELLLADDDAEFRAILRQVLEPHVDLCEADCGEQALEIVRSRHVDLVLLDMHMQQLTGLDTLRLVKSFRAALPCIIITASFSDELQRSATEADAFSVLKKPVSRRTLLQTVSRALESTYGDPEVAKWLSPGS